MGSELAVSSDEVTVRVAEVPFAGEHLRDVAFMLRPRLRNVAMVLGTKADGKVNLAVVLGDDVVARGLNASEIVREAAREIQGGGGGQPFFAMAVNVPKGSTGRWRRPNGLSIPNWEDNPSARRIFRKTEIERLNRYTGLGYGRQNSR